MADNPETRAVEAAGRIAGGRASRPVVRAIHPYGSLQASGGLPPRWQESTGVEVQFIEPPGLEGLGFLQRQAATLEYAIAHPEAFDTYSAFAREIGELVEAGTARPIGDFVAAYDPELRAGPCRIPGTVAQFGEYGGQRFGLPLESSLLSIYYRKDLHEVPADQERFAAQFGYPLAPPATWRELADQIAFFHRPEAGLWGAISIRGAWSYFSFVYRLVCSGGQYFHDDGTPAIADESAVAALEAEAALSAYMPPEVNTWDWMDWYGAFCSGKAYATFAWPSLAKFANAPSFSQVVGKVGYALPAGEVNGERLAVSLNCVAPMWVVSSRAAEPELAYLWAQWNASPTVTGGEIPSIKGPLNPGRECHLTDAAIVQAYTPEYIALMRDCFANAAPEINLPGATRYLTALSAGLDKFFTGQEPSARVALRSVADEWAKITAAHGQEKQAAAYSWLKRMFPEDYRRAAG